jgi:hypothetical protein
MTKIQNLKRFEHWTMNIDGLVKSPKPARNVIPANAGIQLFQIVMDSGFRRSDGN